MKELRAVCNCRAQRTGNLLVITDKVVHFEFVSSSTSEIGNEIISSIFDSKLSEGKKKKKEDVEEIYCLLD